MNEDKLTQTYQTAKEQYASLGVDADAAMKALEAIPISLHCWQGDDVGGFETVGAQLSGGGIQATGNYPGKARTIAELRGDIEKALSLIPGTHRLNLHACYLDNGGKFVDRDADRARPFPELDRLGQAQPPGNGLQSHVLFPCQGGRWLYAGPRG
jgi:L-rhamnose isomerase